MLGHLIYEAKLNSVNDDIYREFKYTLFDASYEKIWEELSDKERDVVIAIAENDGDISVADLKEKLKMDNNNFSTYRDTLIKSGIATNSAYGKISLALPLFRDYIKEYYI